MPKILPIHELIVDATLLYHTIFGAIKNICFVTLAGFRPRGRQKTAGGLSFHLSDFCITFTVLPDVLMCYASVVNFFHICQAQRRKVLAQAQQDLVGAAQSTVEVQSH